MKILITGATGFIGQHMVRFLKKNGSDIYVLGRNPVDNCHYLPLKNAGDKVAIFDAVREVKPDYIFHLAGTTETFDLNEAYSLNVFLGNYLLEALDAFGLSKHTRVLFVGSASEYGNVTENDLPLDEKHCERPVNVYGISKLAQTLHALAWAKRSDAFLIVARPFSILGPGMSEHLAIGSFAKQIKKILEQGGVGKLNTGNLNSHRDFLDVEDVVEIFWNLLNVPKASSQVVNVCSGKAIKMKEIVEYLLALAGGKITIELQNKLIRNIDINMHYGDNKLMLNLVGHYEFTPWHESIKKMIDNYD